MFVRGSLVLIAVFVCGMVLPGLLTQPPVAATSPETTLSAPGDTANQAAKAKPRRDRRGRPGEERFKAAAEGARCTGPGVIVLPKSGRCTHGPDQTPPDLDVTATDRLHSRLTAAAPAIGCEGDGVTGNRIQVLYAYAPSLESHYTSFLANIQEWLSTTNSRYVEHAGGLRHLRFVTDAACQPSVLPVAVSPLALDDFDQMIWEFTNLGLNRRDRIYLTYIDYSDVPYCGIATITYDERRDPGANYNNTGPAYSAVAQNCWHTSTAAHELMHNLGGVQRNAPNSSGYGHCTDGNDIMCYEDGPLVEMQEPPPCDDPDGEESMLDCGKNDYYNPLPLPGTYLASFWNPANNQFLGPGVPDNAPPAVTVTAPKRLLPGKRVKLAAGTADNTGISAVAFRVCKGSSCAWGQGKLIGIDATAPYQATWKVPPRGTFTIVARATDAVGNVATSAPKRVKIKPAKKTKKNGKKKANKAKKARSKSASSRQAETKPASKPPNRRSQ